MADPFEAFRIGAELGQGQSALSAMVKQIVSRFGQQQEAQLKFGGELALEQAKGKIASQRIKETFGGTAGGAGGFVATKYTDPTGITYENPSQAAEISAQEAQAREAGVRRGKVLPVAQTFTGTFKRMVNLSRQVPAPTAGHGRFLQGVGTAYKGFTQEIPQLVQYNKVREAVAGQLIQLVGGESSSRLSDFDVQRAMKLLTNIAFDTSDVRNLSFAELTEALNEIPEVQGAGGISIFDVLNEEEVASARVSQGRYVKTGVNSSTGRRIGQLPDGTIEDLR